MHEAGDKGRSKTGKKAKLSGVSKANVVEGKGRERNSDLNLRLRVPFLLSLLRLLPRLQMFFLLCLLRLALNPHHHFPRRKGTGYVKITKGDVVSAPPTIFDGDEPGSFSEENPGRCFGIVEDAKKNGLVTVRSLPWRQLPCCWLKESIGSKNRITFQQLYTLCFPCRISSNRACRLR